MPKVPNIDRAIIAPAKLTHYLLALTHPRGASKARFFIGFGFRAGRPHELASALLEQAQTHDYVDLQQHSEGTKYAVSGPLRCPDGRSPHVRTIWIIDIGRSEPRP